MSLVVTTDTVDRLFAYFDRLMPGDRLVLALVLAGLVISFFTGMLSFGNKFLVEIPRAGGVFTEGFVGVPRFVNPVLAVTQIDKDLAALVYAGVMKVDASGELVYDLTERIDVSPEGTTYTISLAQDRTWSDGAPVTAEDVAFTLRSIQDTRVGSPLRAQFQNVSIEVVGTYEVVLTIPVPDAGFLESLTVGILPSHLWSTIAPDRFSYSEYNMAPIGAGAFVLESQKISKDGTPEEFTFMPNTAMADAPHITFRAQFFVTEEARMKALTLGKLDAASGVDAKQAVALQGSDRITLVTRALPRTFGIFFNQKTSPALLDTAAREAISILVDRDAIAHAVLGEYATATNEPLAPLWQYNADASSTRGTAENTTGVEAARERLASGGWQYSEADGTWSKKLAGATTTLSFTLTTLSAPIFMETAAFLAQSFAAVGIPVKVQARERAEMNTTIATRSYEVLLYGTAYGRTRDLYPFWHSSRRADPGLNVALYANLSADSALDHMRGATSTEVYARGYDEFMTAFRADTPAVFLFSPSFIYAVRRDVSLTLPERMVEQTERFALVSQWYKETEQVWSVFAK